MDGEPKQLVLLSDAQRMLTEAKTLDEVKNIRDKAVALRHYLAAQKHGFSLQNDAAEIKIRAERKAGEMLAEMPKHQGGRPTETGSSVEPVSLAEIGIGKKQSHRWQRVADLPVGEFEAYISDTKSASKELTTAGVLKLAAKHDAQQPSEQQPEHEDCSDSLEDFIKSGVKFGTVYADPAWQYGNQGTRAATDNHYSTMTVDEICDLPIEKIVADSAHLHLWTTNAFLFDAKRVMEAWGFEYKSVMIWVKPQLGIGNYWRVSHEFMLFGIRGKSPFRDRSIKSWLEHDRLDHSVKPEAFRNLIQRVSPGPYIELFSRRAMPGWSSWGNQIEAHIFGDTGV